jgi:glucose/mannose-6-phosphate isomerase
MQRVIERLPDHIAIALEDTLPQIEGGPYRRAVLVGLGGSALPADVLNDAFTAELETPLEVWRSYGLPPADAATLIVISSFSGTTEETLSAVEELSPHARNVIVVTAGGRLAEIAAQRQYPLIRIPTEHEPAGFQPRSAFGYFVTYFARVLHAAGLMASPYASLANVQRTLTRKNVRKAAEETAFWVGDTIPIVYTDVAHLLSVARVAKIKFNENSKRPSFFNAFPELNHNEMIGFSANLAQFSVLYLHDPTSHPRIRQRFAVMKQAFARDRIEHVSFREWEMPGASRSERVFTSLMFADWCSYTVALLAGLDPTPVVLVERFKQLLETGSTAARIAGADRRDARDA